MAIFSIAALASKYFVFTPSIPAIHSLKASSYPFSSTITRNTTTITATMSANPLNPRPHPSLEVSGGALDSFLPAFTTLDRPYDPYPLVCSNTHLETVFAHFFRSKPDVRYRRECLRTKDNGAVALDWVAGDDRNLSPNSPTLILLVKSNIFPLQIPPSFSNEHYHYYIFFFLIIFSRGWPEGVEMDT